MTAAVQREGDRPLFGRRVQIAGSASADADTELTRRAHEIVAATARRILMAGGGLVLAMGKEPVVEHRQSNPVGLVFDWTALEVVASCFREGYAEWPSNFGLPVVLVGSEKAESEIPDYRRALYDELLRSNRVQLEFIMSGSRAAAFIRQRQAAFGDALLVLGGGTGVEHLAELYLHRRKAVIPLDLAIGASRGDGTGGGLRISKQARAEPARFIRLSPSFSGTEGAALAQVGTQNGSAAPDHLADAIAALLNRLARPDVFYVRLVNQRHATFEAVESFFRNVVDPVVAESGMNHIEIGRDRSEHAFMNVAIFESLHFSSLAVVDVTGERPNCFIELGYALGNGTRVLVTAEEGTPLPFDQQAIPCHFWRRGDSPSAGRKAFNQFWEKQINRPPIVRAL